MTPLKLFRFTFVHGYYDLGQAVVMARTMEEAEQKLTEHCKTAHPEQGSVGKDRWLMETVQREDPNGNRFEPTEISGDVALCYGVDG